MCDQNYEFTLDDVAVKYCAEILNETPETRHKALQEIKQWAAENPQLCIRTDDHAIIPFLRGCKFNLEKTKVKLTNYSLLRRDAPEWFHRRDPLLPEIQELIRLGVFIPLKKPTKDNRLVVIIRTAAHDPKKHKQDDVFKTGKMILDVVCKENENAQIFGVNALFDMKGVSLGHARQLTPPIIKKSVFAWQNYHCRPKSLDFINAPVYVNVVLSVFKSFMTEKMKSRVQVHYNTNPEALHKLVPKEILPVEYGGDDGTLDELLGYWNDKLKSYSEWFRDDERYKAD